MDFTQYVVLGAVLAGVTELINRLRAEDYWVVASIVTCAVVGGVFGALELASVPNVETGILVGFGASGALKALNSVGNKTVPSKSRVTSKKG